MVVVYIIILFCWCLLVRVLCFVVPSWGDMSMVLPPDGTVNYDADTFKDGMAKVNLDFFSQYCFNETYPNTWFHTRWYDTVQDESVRRAISIAPRNSAKTTCWAKKAPLWLLGRNPNIKILLLSRAAERAESNLRFIKQNIESNPMIQRVFPGLEQWEPWSNDKISVKNSRNDGEVSVAAKGLGGQITGIRADILIVDDLIDKKNVMTETQRDKVHEFWDEHVIPTLNPDGRIFCVGTRYHNKDWYTRILEETPSYKDHIFTFPAFKVDEEGKVIYVDEEGKRVREDEGLPISYWPERWSPQRLLEVKEDVTYRDGNIAWATQYMCDPSGYEGRMFQEEWLAYYTYEDLLPKLPNLTYYMSIDPNISEDPKSDNTAIVTIAVDGKTKEVYVLDIFAKPLGFTEQGETLQMYGSRTQLRVGSDHLPGEQRIHKIAVESVAYQKALFATGFTQGLPVAEVHHTKTAKVTRVLRIQPHIQNGRVKFPDPEESKGVDWWNRFLEEYLKFPRGRRDDMMDALEMVIDIAGLIGGGSRMAYGPGGSRYEDRRQFRAPGRRVTR